MTTLQPISTTPATPANHALNLHSRQTKQRRRYKVLFQNYGNSDFFITRKYPHHQQINMTLSLEALFLSSQGKALFPLQTISSLEKLFEIEVLSKQEPNLAVFSIILGAIENSLVHLEYNVGAATVAVISGDLNDPAPAAGGVSAPVVIPEVQTKVMPTARKVAGRKRGRPRRVVEFKDVATSPGTLNGNGAPASLTNGKNGHEEGLEEDANSVSDKENVKGDFPPLELDTVEALFLNFVDILKTYVDLSEFGVQEGAEITSSPRDLVKRVSDVVWSYLSRSYKADGPHIQSLYTYLTGKKLDSFGVSMVVAAGCQLLGLKDVQLALSEDHSWLGFGQTHAGKTGRDTLEVTWHGKGFEDRRGKEAGLGDDDGSSWLYLKGHAVYCTPHMGIAALVTSINYTIQPLTYSSELIQIQQKLLWKLYDAGHLKKFLPGLITLADLEEINPTPGKAACPTLYQETILSSRTFYEDMHIYPYTSYAAYCYRKQDFKTALKYWAHAARIVQKYRRSRSDEEIYREFFEISTDYLQNVMKSCSTGFSANSINRDPVCFANLMRLFDGICAWEERSTSNIVHITWAKAWISCIAKFDYTIRRMVRITESALVDASGNDINSNGSIEDEFEKDSGIDEEDEPAPCVTLFSKKLHQIKDFFKREKFNPSAITLLLTAQTAMDDAVTEKESNNTNGSGPSGRSRRERVSTTEKATSKYTNANGDLDNGPARKRAKLSTNNSETTTPTMH